MARTEDKTQTPDWNQVLSRYVETGELPEAYTEAKEHYFQVLSKDPAWVQEHRGRWVAVSGTEVLGFGRDIDKFVDKIEKTHGDQPFFVHKVGAPIPHTRIVSPRGFHQ